MPDSGTSDGLEDTLEQLRTLYTADNPRRDENLDICRRGNLGTVGVRRWNMVDPLSIDRYIEGKKLWSHRAQFDSPLSRTCRVGQRLQGRVGWGGVSRGSGQWAS